MEGANGIGLLIRQRDRRGRDKGRRLSLSDSERRRNAIQTASRTGIGRGLYVNFINYEGTNGIPFCTSISISETGLLYLSGNQKRLIIARPVYRPEDTLCDPI